MMKKAELMSNPEAVTGVRPLTRSLRSEASDMAGTETPTRDASVLTARAWDHTVRTHRASIYSLAYRLTGSSHDAEDLTQDVFFNLLLYPSTFSPSISGSRLHTVTKALYRDQLLLRRSGMCHGFVREGEANRLPTGEDTYPSIAPHEQTDEIHASLAESVR
jgi:DNA-directed RNA polymerase specialized sigma24 family protein